MFVEEGFEDLEFWVTVMRLREEGADVTIVGTHAGERAAGRPTSCGGTTRSRASFARPMTRARSSG